MNRITMRRLACGMPLLVETMSGVRSAAMTWLVPAGTAAEPRDRLGLASVVAEMLMRGAGALDSRQHADALDRLGVSRSAEAMGPHLRLGATMVGDRLVPSLPLLVDMILRPRLEAEALGPARDLALQELESLADNPQERAVRAARLRHFPEPHNRSTLGDEPGLKAMTIDDVRGFWSRRARPEGSILAVAGAVDPEQVESTLNTLLAGWSGSAGDATTSEPPPRGYEHEDDETNQVQIIVMSDAPPEPAPESILEKVVVNVLSGGMSGRLFSEVREKRGLCYSVSAGYGAGKLFGSVLGYVGTTPEHAQESLEVLLAEMHRINTPAGAVEREEFDRAIVGMKSRLVFSGESTGARAGSIAGDQYRLGRPRSLEEMASEIDAVTLDRVNDYLKTRSLGRITVQTLGPKALVMPG